MAEDEVSQRAILDEALKKGALVWLEAGTRSHARWYAWTGEHVYVLTGGGEQPDPGLEDGTTTEVVVRSKDNRHRLIAFRADVSILREGDPDWHPATADLAKARLNLPDPAGAPARWAAPDFTLYRLTPQMPLTESVGDVSNVSRRATPMDTSATTAGPRPRILHRRGRPGRQPS